LASSIINKEFLAASAFAAAGAVLTFFGFMHGESVGIAVTPSVAAAYTIVAVFLLAIARIPQSKTAAANQGDLAAVPAE
jgi:adenine/guanine/hypoxanthine permease